MFKKSIAVLLAVITAAGLLFTGCGEGDSQKVYVESVETITGTGYTGLNNRYSGMIVSGSTQKIEKDRDKKILKLNVSVGDSVKAGDVLFSYDVQAVELALKRLELEVEQLENSLTLLKTNIKDCEKKIKSAKGDQKLTLEVQLQGYQIEQKEKNLELSAKKTEIDRTGEMLENSDVTAKVSGVVQSINKDNAGETDENGEVIPYITIIETGAYRVKGSVSELDVHSLFEGAPVIIRSRVDDNTWTGFVEYIEWETPEKNQNEFYVPDSENSASKYPFYVVLDSTDGLLMGQHVYIEMDNGENSAMMLPEYYIMDADSDSPWVWAVGKRDRIEKRDVELGEYDEVRCSYEILSGLTDEDFIAFPDDTVEAGMSVTYELLPEEDMGEMDEGMSEDFVEGEEFVGEIMPEDEFFDEDMMVDSEVAFG